jgi:hypothetical protein
VVVWAHHSVADFHLTTSVASLAGLIAAGLSVADLDEVASASIAEDLATARGSLSAAEVGSFMAVARSLSGDRSIGGRTTFLLRISLRVFSPACGGSSRLLLPG